MEKKSILIILILFFISLFSIPKSVFATRFTIVAPTGTLTQGQDVPFTLNIDTQGVAVTLIQSGMDYNTSYLQYVSAVPGSAMNSIVTDTSAGAGKLAFTGTNTSGFNGSGVFATVTFKIIAASPGSTEICTLWTPPAITPTITPVPTTPAAVTCNSSCSATSPCPSNLACYIVSGQTSGVCRKATCTDRVDCVCLQPTSPPVATALPQTGNDEPKNIGTIAGGVFILIAGSILFLSKKNQYHHPNTKMSLKKK